MVLAYPGMTLAGSNIYKALEAEAQTRPQGGRTGYPADFAGK